MSSHQIQTLNADNARAIPELIFAVYGDTYESPWMYEPDRLLAAAARREMAFFLAVDDAGTPRGCVALSFRFPTRKTAFFSTLLIHPDIRGVESGLVFRDLARAIRKEADRLAEQEELRILFSSEVTIHPLSQRLIAGIGFVNCGLYLAWCPAWACRERAHQQTASGRHEAEAASPRIFSERRAEAVSAYPFRTLVSPYTVSLPSRYADLLRAIYRAMKLNVGFVAPAAAKGTTETDLRLDYSRGLATLDVLTLGRDATDVVLDRFERCRNGMLDLIHVFLPLNQGSLDPLVDALTARGCVYCALLPCYRTGDALVLQFLNGIESGLKRDQLYTPLAKMIFDHVRNGSYRK